MTHSAYKQK